MKTIIEKRAALKTLHEQAGQRYAAAAQELLSAWSDLLAVGEAASNRHVGAIDEGDRFASVHPRIGVHPKFLPSMPNNDVLIDRAHKRAAELLTEFNEGETA